MQVLDHCKKYKCTTRVQVISFNDKKIEIDISVTLNYVLTLRFVKVQSHLKKNEAFIIS